MPITSAERARRLEDAWDLSKTSAISLRVALRQLEKKQGQFVQAGSLSSISANGRVSQFSSYGPGSVTPQEVADCYRQLINHYGEALRFLTSCANFGLDPFVTEFQIFSQGNIVGSPVVLDQTGRFVQICREFDIDSTSVVNRPVSDAAVFCWLMYHEQPAMEERPDFTWMRVGEGAHFV